MFERLDLWLRGLGLAPTLAMVAAFAGGLLAIALLSLVVDVAARRLLLRLVSFLISRTHTTWDDKLLERRVFNRLAHLAPAVVVYRLLPLYFVAYPAMVDAGQKLAGIYMIVLGLLVIGALLSAAEDIYRSFPISRHVPLKGFLQVIKIVIYCLGGIVVLAILLDKTPLYLLSGVGALTAVLLIVFRDPILGFVAGIQLSANDMVAIGDWIEMPSHSADGDVIDVALTTVKVQNWDKTITTVPTYDLIARPFKNWRGMEQSGGRRIKRAINLDLDTIRFCDAAMLERLARIQLLRDYLSGKERELAEHNAERAVDPASVVNGRRLTNVGTLRAYVLAYLRAHPAINQEMTLLVRQRPSTEHGLPIEIYAFCADKVWANYEAIQSDIFDHILAVVPEFGLRVYQRPSGRDLAQGLAR